MFKYVSSTITSVLVFSQSQCSAITSLFFFNRTVRYLKKCDIVFFMDSQVNGYNIFQLF